MERERKRKRERERERESNATVVSSKCLHINNLFPAKGTTLYFT